MIGGLLTVSPCNSHKNKINNACRRKTLLTTPLSFSLPLTYFQRASLTPSKWHWNVKEICRKKQWRNSTCNILKMYMSAFITNTFHQYGKVLLNWMHSAGSLWIETRRLRGEGWYDVNCDHLLKQLFRGCNLIERGVCMSDLSGWT